MDAPAVRDEASSLPAVLRTATHAVARLSPQCSGCIMSDRQGSLGISIGGDPAAGRRTFPSRFRASEATCEEEQNHKYQPRTHSRRQPRGLGGHRLSWAISISAQVNPGMENGTITIR